MRPGRSSAAFLLAVTTALLAGPLPRGRAADRVDPPKEYEAAVAALERFIEGQVADKDLPALSVALVDDQRIVWRAASASPGRRRRSPPRPRRSTGSAPCRSCLPTSP